MMSQTKPESLEPNAKDEQIASEPELAPLNIPDDSVPVPVEQHLAKLHARPVAVAGIVENGVVRPLDPDVKLPEHARVIIVASEAP